MIERLRILFLTAALILPLASTAIVHAQAPTEGAAAQAEPHRGGEASLVLPDLSQVTFLNGIDGHTLLFSGIVVSVFGLIFGLVIYRQLKNLAVHPSMLEVSELIYATCRTYLETQNGEDPISIEVVDDMMSTNDYVDIADTLLKNGRYQYWVEN